MGISKRHHYIPQFLIRRFADNNNMLYVYDKQKKRIVDEMRSPKSMFFEMNRNTLNIGGVLNDSLEKLYAQLDEKFSNELNKITTTEIISDESLMTLLLMVSTLKWRLPVNDEMFINKDNDYPFDTLPIKVNAINSDDSQNQDAINYLLNSEIFSHLKRLIFPILPFYENLELAYEKILKLHKNCFINKNDNIKSILGDSPIIENNSSDVEDFGNFILPLGNTETFICVDSNEKKIKNIGFYTNKDLAVFHQAKKYVVCGDRDHLNSIIKTYNYLEISEQTNLINEHIFNFF